MKFKPTSSNEENLDVYENDGFVVDDVDGDETSKQRKRKSKSVKELLNENSHELVEEDVSFGLSSRSISKRCKNIKKSNRRSGKEVIDVGETISPKSKKSQACGKAKFNISDQCKGFASTSYGHYTRGDEDVEVLTDSMEDEHTAKRQKHVSSRRPAYSKVRISQKGTGNSSSVHKEAGKLLRDVAELFEGCDGHEINAKKIEDQDFEEESVQPQQRRHVFSQKDLEIELESTVLEERYMTEKDHQIFQEDVPERLQFWIQKLGEISQGLKARESEWIYERLFGHLAISMPVEFGQIAKLDRSQIVEQITNILELLHDLKVEIPFIAMYRKELCLNLLIETEDLEQRPTLKRYKALWAVWYLDRKWQLLQHRRADLNAAFASHTFKLKDKSADQHELLQQVIEALDAALSEEEVDDIEKKFNLYFASDDVETGEGQYKRPKWRSEYSMYCMDGYRQISKHFGLSPKHLGENLQAKSKVHIVTDATLTPEEAASEFCNTKSALQCARKMVALEISVEPSVCDYFRKFFSESCAVTTRPTSEGLRIIDSFHPYAGVKFLENQPLDKFVDDSWLLIQNAEEEKLLEVRLGFEEQFLKNHLMQEVIPLYLSNDVGPNFELWNEQRRQALQHSVSYLIVPNLEKEIRLKLSGRAKQWVATHCGDRLWKLVSTAPYSSPADNLEAQSFKGEGKRVMACCWGPGKPATTFVILDSWGNLSDILHTGYLGFHASSLEQQQRKQKDQQQLLQFFKNNRPDVLVLGATNMSCRYLKADIDEVVGKLQESNSQSVDMYSFQVIYGDEAIPRLYDQSNAAEEQLKQQPGIVRRAVALGRYLQNPLALVSSLFGRSKDILSLKLHRLQGSLVPDELYEVFECLMVTLTNQVGLDLCPALSHEWLLAPLQFISGIGPRKSAFIIQALRSIKSLNSRQDLLSSLGLMKRNIFLNAAGFIRISKNRQTSTVNQGSNDVLDDTRIHPESYELANRMAEDACCQEPVDNSVDLEAENVDIPVLNVRKHPHKLQHLDLESYASIVEARGFGKKLETLRDIKIELQHGFEDWRGQYTSPSEDENFWLLTGENEESLAEGKLVKATVRKVQENQVLCVLECGLPGKISTKDHQEGSILECMVKEIDKTKYFVQLTICNEELISDYKKLDAVSQDVSLMSTAQEQLPKTHEDKKRKFESENSRCFKQRLIVHPCFQNCSLVEAKEELSRKDAGSVFFHPSTKGASYLSMTLKLYDEIYMHVDISERQKDIHDFASFSRLGNTLLIGDKVFEDLDQVIAQYVSPLMSHWKEMHQHRKFILGTKAEVDEQICKEKKESPSHIPYHFALCYEHPGAFTLAYARSNPSLKLHHEFVSVVPSGFRFRKTMFENPDELVDYFQKHFNDPILPLPLISEQQMDFGRGRFRGRGRRGRGNTGQRFERNLDSSQEGQENSESAQWNEDGNWNSNDESGRGRGWRQNGRGRGKDRGSGRRGRWSNQGDYKKEEQSFEVAAYDSTGGWDGACTDTAELSGRGQSDWSGGWNMKGATENSDGWNKTNEGSDAGGWGESRELAKNDWPSEKNGDWNKHNEKGSDAGGWGESRELAKNDWPSEKNGDWNKHNEKGSEAGGWGGSKELVSNDWGQSQSIHDKNLNGKDESSGSWQLDKLEDWQDKERAASGDRAWQTGRGRGRDSERRGTWGWNQGRGRAQEEPSERVFKQDENQSNDRTITGKDRCGGESGWAEQTHVDLKTENLGKEEPGNIGWGRTVKSNEGWDGHDEIASGDRGNLETVNITWGPSQIGFVRETDTRKRSGSNPSQDGDDRTKGRGLSEDIDVEQNGRNRSAKGELSRPVQTGRADVVDLQTELNWKEEPLDAVEGFQSEWTDSTSVKATQNSWDTQELVKSNDGRGKLNEEDKALPIEKKKPLDDGGWGWNSTNTTKNVCDDHDRLLEDKVGNSGKKTWNKGCDDSQFGRGRGRGQNWTDRGKYEGKRGGHALGEERGNRQDHVSETISLKDSGTGWNDGAMAATETMTFGSFPTLWTNVGKNTTESIQDSDDGWGIPNRQNKTLSTEMENTLDDRNWGWNSSGDPLEKEFGRESEGRHGYKRDEPWCRGRDQSQSGCNRGWRTSRGRGIEKSGGQNWGEDSSSRQDHVSEKLTSKDDGSSWLGDALAANTSAIAGELCADFQRSWKNDIAAESAEKGWDIPGMTKGNDGWEKLNKENEALPNEVKEPLNDGGWGWSIPSVGKTLCMSEIDSCRESEDGSGYLREKPWNRGRGENFSGHGHGRGWTGRGSGGGCNWGKVRGSRQDQVSEAFASENKGSKWDRVTTFATAGEPRGGLQSGWSKDMGADTAGKGWDTQGMDKVDDGWENFNKEKEASPNEAKEPSNDGCAATEEPRGGFQGSWNKDVSADTAGKGSATQGMDKVDDGWENFNKEKEASPNEVKEPLNDGGVAAEESRGGFLGGWNKDVSADTAGKGSDTQGMDKVDDGWEKVFNKEKEASPNEVKEPSNAGGWGCSFPSKNKAFCVSKNDSDRDSENRSAYLNEKPGDKGRDESLSGRGRSWGWIDREKGAGSIGGRGWGEEGGSRGDQDLEAFARKDKGGEWGGETTVATARESLGRFQYGWTNDVGAKTDEKGWDVQGMDDNNWGKLNKNKEAVPTDVKESLDCGWGQGFSSINKDTCTLENDSKSELEERSGYSRAKPWNRGRIESQDSRGRGWQHVERGRGRGRRGGQYWGEERGSIQNQVSEAFTSKDHGRERHGDAMTATVGDPLGGFQACWTDAVVEKKSEKGWDTQGSDKGNGGWEMLSKEKFLPNEVKDPLDNGGWGWSNASKSFGVSEKVSGDRFGHSRPSSWGREQDEGQSGHGRSWGRSGRGRGRGRERTDGHGWGGGTNNVGMETSGNKWSTQGMANDDKCWSNLHEKKESSSNEAKDDGGWGWSDPSVIKNTSGAVDRDFEKLSTDTFGDSRARSWNRGLDNNQTSGDWEQRGTGQGKERTNSCGWGGGSAWKGASANVHGGEKIGWTNNVGMKTTENGWSTQEMVTTPMSDDAWGEINQDIQPLSNEVKEPLDDGGCSSSIPTNKTSELEKGSCRGSASDSKPWNRGREENESCRGGAWGQTGRGRGTVRRGGFNRGWESSQQNQGSEVSTSKDDKSGWSVACATTTVGLSPVGSQLGWTNEAAAETSKNGWCTQEIANSDDGWGKLDEEIKPLDTEVKKHSDDSGWGQSSDLT